MWQLLIGIAIGLGIYELAREAKVNEATYDPLDLDIEKED